MALPVSKTLPVERVTNVTAKALDMEAVIARLSLILVDQVHALTVAIVFLNQEASCVDVHPPTPE